MMVMLYSFWVSLLTPLNQIYFEFQHYVESVCLRPIGELQKNLDNLELTVCLVAEKIEKRGDGKLYVCHFDLYVEGGFQTFKSQV